VKLPDGGTTDEGLPYLVMDYVDGQPIDAYCDQHQLTVEDRLRLFRTVCGAVEHAHQNRIIHRDLKPSNILVTADGSPRLLDFGIAKLLSPELSPDMGLMTTAGIHHMTPAYASPEQVRGDAITYASDVYSLGVVLYELLTGHRPYRFKNYSQAEVERVICETEAERPSTIVTRAESDQGPEGSSGHIVTPDGVSRARGVPLEKLRRRLKGDLDNIMLKALHKEPQRRYHSVQEFSEDIARHLEDHPVKARPNTLQYRARKFLRRRKTEAIATVVVLAVLLSAAAFATWQEQRATERAQAQLSSQHPKGRRSVAVLGFKNLSGRSDTAWLSTAVAEMLTTELAAGGRLRTISGEETAQANVSGPLPETDSLSGETLTRIHKSLGSDYVVWGSYLAKGDSSRDIRVDLRLEDAVTGKSAAVVADSGTDTTLPDLAARLGAQLRDRLGIPDITPAELASTRASLPSNPDAARFYAEGLARMRVFDALGARELLQKAIASESDFALAHSALADAWVALGYDAKGQEEARRAYDLSGKLSREERLLVEGRYREAMHE
jgi:TolB-like protein